MGFAQEVKDFLAGYETVTRVAEAGKKGKRDQQALDDDKAYKDALLELRGQELDISRQKLSQASGKAGAAAARAAERMEWDRERHDAWREDRTTTNENAAEDRQDAEDADAYAGFGEPTTGWDPEEHGITPDGEVPTQGFAEGGLVEEEDNYQPDIPFDPRALPDGGPVSRRPMHQPQTPVPGPRTSQVAGAAPPDEAPPARPGALSLDTPDGPAPKPAADERDPTTAVVRPDLMRIVVDRSREATTAGVQALEKEFTTPRSAVTGEGGQNSMEDPGLSFEELEEMREKVDPNGVIPDYLKTAATMSEAFTYFKNRGEMDKATEVAKKILMAERRVSQTLGTLAVNALEGGQVEEACKLFNDACNRFPSAHEIRVTPDANGVLAYEVKNEGEVLESGKLQGREFLEMAGQVANGQLFMNSALHFVADNTKPTGGNPNQALELAGNTQAQAVAAQGAYQDTIDPSTGEGDPELLAAAQAAAQAAEQARVKALDLGAKMPDITAAARAAGERAQTPGGVTPAGNAPVPINSKAERDALPSGTRYVLPDGREFVKK